MQNQELTKLDLEKGGLDEVQVPGIELAAEAGEVGYVFMPASEQKEIFDVCCKLHVLWPKVKEKLGGQEGWSWYPAIAVRESMPLHQSYLAAQSSEFRCENGKKLITMLEQDQVAVFVVGKDNVPRLERQHYSPLSYQILRGKGTIGNLIEVRYGPVRILLDCGQELKDEPAPELSELEKQVLATPYDAVLISHYHLDHAAHVERVSAPVYMGKGCLSVMQSERKYVHAPELKHIRTFESQVEFEISHGDLKVSVKPFLVDHSAYDSYMFLISAGGKSLLYTGDFRSNGRKSFQALLARLPDKVDYLICEATNLHSTRPSRTEADLEKAAAELMAKYDRVFVFQAGTNIDRIVTFYKASRKTGKKFFIDRYVAGITENLPSIPNVKTFKDVFSFWAMPRLSNLEDCRRNEINWRLNKFHALGYCEIGCPKHPVFGDLSHFTMLVRPTMAKLLELADKDKQSRFNFSIFENSIMLYSLWKGYKEEEDVQAFLNFFAEHGVEVVDLHTSGHADEFAIDSLKSKVNPTVIEYVHYFENL